MRQGLRHRNLQDFHVDGCSSLGVALLERSASAEFWEIHDGGDELLYVMYGKLAVDVRQPDGTSDWETIAAGQCIFITRGAAHAVIVLEDAAVVYMTPREGSRTWQAGSAGGASS